jgi:hypothetical protein
MHWSAVIVVSRSRSPQLPAPPAVSACVAGVEAISRLIHPQTRGGLCAGAPTTTDQTISDLNRGAVARDQGDAAHDPARFYGSFLRDHSHRGSGLNKRYLAVRSSQCYS